MCLPVSCERYGRAAGSVAARTWLERRRNDRGYFRGDPTAGLQTTARTPTLIRESGGGLTR